MIFEFVTLTLKLDLLKKNINIGHTFKNKRDGTLFILHLCIACKQTFHHLP